MSEERQLTAHEILATHVTNVSEITAMVIRRACEEHEALRESCRQASRATTLNGASAGATSSEIQELQKRADELVRMSSALSATIAEALSRTGGACQKTNGRRPTHVGR